MICRILSPVVITSTVTMITRTNPITEYYCHIANSDQNCKYVPHNVECQNTRYIQIYIQQHPIWPPTVLKSDTLTVTVTSLSMLVRHCGPQQAEQSIAQTIMLIHVIAYLKSCHFLLYDLPRDLILMWPRYICHMYKKYSLIFRTSTVRDTILALILHFTLLIVYIYLYS